LRLKKKEKNMLDGSHIDTISMNYAGNGNSVKSNEFGMRAMQERAYEKRGEQYLLIKSPPASGKSRALMFIALDKLANQGIKKAIIAVPEKSIGASFHNEPLSQFGFSADWTVEPKWNLCDAPGEDGGKVKSVKAFLESQDDVLVCTHASFRFAVDKYGIEVFDDCLIAIDEFHHVSANPDNKLGDHLSQIITRDKTHIVAMTGSYFRGDAVPVLHPEDEGKFETVTYTYYEQLNGYTYLKRLDIGYYFYSGAYVDDILKVLDPNEKTIIHIPSVNSRESTKDKIKEVENILEELGEWQGRDPDTGFHLVKTKDGRILKIADLVDDSPERSQVADSLKDSNMKVDPGHVDIIIALGMAKEGFDWVWCEHALTVGYRASLTEVVQIIGRATRDAQGKSQARFTNLISEPDASEGMVREAVNDTLKAISASLLMEQVLAPRFNFTPKNKNGGPTEGYDYGEDGYNPDKNNVGYNDDTGQLEIEITGLVEPVTQEGKRICQEDINDVVAAFVQDPQAAEQGMFREDTPPEDLNIVKMGRIVAEKYPGLAEEDHEAIRQRAVAAVNLIQQAKSEIQKDQGDGEPTRNTALIDGVRKFSMDVRDLDIDLIDSINPFGSAYAIMGKTVSEGSLRDIADYIAAKKVHMSHEEAKALATRALQFKKENGRLPSITSNDPWEKRMAEGIAYLQRKATEASHE
jgi:superfamily II DNA or RNA helicase